MRKITLLSILALLPSLLFAQAIKFEFSNIRFKTGSAVIETATLPALDTLGQFLMRSGAKVEVAGHTDNVGDKRKNRKLSQQRAQSVCNYLTTKHRIAPSQLTAKGYGDLIPLMPNLTDEYRAKNRRVEITVLSKIRTARLSYLQGNIFARKQGISKFQPASLGQVLTILDEVVTDSTGRAEITFDNGSRVKVNPSSDLVIEEQSWETGNKKAQVGLNLIAGKAYAKISKLGDKKESFSLGTPTAVAGIRGTEFVVESKPDRTALLSVWEDDMMWRGQIANSRDRAVAAGQGSRCLPGQQPEPPLDLPKPPRPITPAANDTFFYNPDKPKSINFTWTRQGGIKTHLIVAKDYELKEVVADVVTEKESFSLKPGKTEDVFYWMLTAIDDIGLEGQPWPTRTLRLVRKIEGPRLRIGRPKMGEKVNQLKMLVDGSTDLKTELAINGKAALISAAGDFSEPILLKAGENIVTVTAVDRAGNESAASLQIFCAPTPALDATLNVGTIKLMGGELDAAAPGLLGAVRLVYNLNQYWGLGVAVGYGQSGVEAGVWEPRAADYFTTVVPAAALGRFLILPESKISLYVTMEAGAVSWQNKLSGVSQTSGTALFGALGTGVKFAVSERVSILAEASAGYMIADAVNAGTHDKNNLIVRGGVGVMFGF
ncbi:OmpA family protein [candidate division TA06 bacterium]|uniref:OmpA family protein n=1 Tax=candidate division TA06 bacterium TaxID=2250710 RepID=A0A933MLS5_UNCT6|nr:OmpA family protein [candidate division TA06 bacterium]